RMAAIIHQTDKRSGITYAYESISYWDKEKKQAINWEERRSEFETIVQEVKHAADGYECLIPVSGGKDSTMQVVKALEYGLRVLAVTWRTPARTPIGQQNLDNLIRLGVDHVDYTINPDVERRFMYKTLVEKGDTAIPMHMALFAIPLRIATAYGIPLVLWGESPHMEYGGTPEERRRNSLDFQWLKTHGILHGTSVDDWIDEHLTRKDLEAYRLPDEEEFKRKGIRSIFLGFYFEWDPEESLRIAREHGFRPREEGPKVGYYNYADIDCDFISVHHHFKWLKFGCTRLFDNLAIEIRNGRMTRDEAISIIAKRGDQTPHEDIKKLCDFMQISLEHYRDIEDRFRNPEIWSRERGKWVIRDFLIKDWEWT
ncbi:MAG TPA: N-acetyl sugar amidotransferase, partial [Desulfobacterales bacterium]|nr:N-acetyl sugar amidotransferase [Desulfobacterales bacterium]